jgi:asparagine synthase (glutamine-hydrolysing)
LPTSHRNISFDFKLKRTLTGLSYGKPLWNPVWMGPLEPTELDALFGEPIDIEDVYSEAIEAWERCENASLVDRTLQFFTRLYLQDDILTKVDRASMMHSLEVRSPFLDIELVDFARRLPHDFKFRKGETKFLLKRAMGSLLPAAVIHRSKKGFGVPIGRWFQEGQLSFETVASAELSAEFRERQLREHGAGRTDNRLYLYNHWLLDAHGAVRGAVGAQEEHSSLPQGPKVACR